MFCRVLHMGKVIAFDRNRLRSRPQTTAYAEGMRSQAGARGGSAVRPFPQKREDIAVSVIVPACGHPHLLSHCLASLLFQQFDANRYEIIVVDDKPNRATRNIVNDWAKHAGRTGPAISYIAGHGSGGISAARNRGWRAARGSIVAFTDDDTVARPDWLQKGLQSFEDEDVKAVWGRVVTPDTPHTSTIQALGTGVEKLQAFAAANYFVRKPVLEEIGGFDERFQFAWGEEADLYFRLSSHHSRLVHHPQAVVTQPARASKLGNRLAAQRSHQAEVLLSKKHPQLYRQKMQSTPYRESYLITLVLMLSVTCLLAGASVLAATGTTLWALLTVHLWSRQWRAAHHAPSRLLDTLLVAVLTPPLTVFWHLVGLLRFRHISP